MQIDFARLRKNRWVRLAVLFVILVVISLALAVLFKRLLSPLEDELGGLAWLAYLIVFGANFLSNLTVIAPVSVGTSIMVTAAGLGIYHPVVIALFAALGGALGEIGGYLAGTLGKKVAFNDYPEAYERVSSWVNRYGMWAIAVLSFQPILPFEIGGFISGVARMPIRKFFV